MLLKTLSILGPQHGYGRARRIEQTSGSLLSINDGTLYPVLLRLEQEGSIDFEWGVSENNRKAKYYPDHQGREKGAGGRRTRVAEGELRSSRDFSS